MDDLQTLWADDVGVDSVIIEDESPTRFGKVILSNGLVLPITYLTDADDVVVDWDECVWIHFGCFEYGARQDALRRPDRREGDAPLREAAVPSKTPKQARTMRAVAHDPELAKKLKLASVGGEGICEG